MVSSSTPKERPLLPLSEERLGQFQISLRRLIDDHEILNPIKHEPLEVRQGCFLVLFRVGESHLSCKGSQGRLLKVDFVF